MKFKRTGRIMAGLLLVSSMFSNAVFAEEEMKETEIQTNTQTELSSETNIQEKEQESETAMVESAEETETTEPQTEQIQETQPAESESVQKEIEIPVIEIQNKKDREKPKIEDTKTEEREHNREDQEKEADSNYVPIEALAQRVEPEKVDSSFRFHTVKKKYALTKRFLNVYGVKNEESVKVGTLKKGAICYIIEKSDDTWSYIESGKVRGFVKTESLKAGKQVRAEIFRKGEDSYDRGIPLKKNYENPAWTYRKETTMVTTVAKVYAVSNTEGLNIREEKNQDARRVGTLKKGALCFILADKDQEWVYIESKDVRGFVKKEYLILGRAAKEIVKKQGEETMSFAEQLLTPEENKSCYYTLTSVTSAEDAHRKYLGNFTLTAYCSCPVCCGKWSGGMAAGGVYPVEGRTVAMGGVDFGTKLIVGDQVFTVEDRGTPYGHIDIYMVNHADAAAFGKQSAEVYLLKE